MMKLSLSGRKEKLDHIVNVKKFLQKFDKAFLKKVRFYYTQYTLYSVKNKQQET